MSFINDRMKLTDAGAMRALAHEIRLEIFNYLLDSGDATATECADAVGESPSSCSYHLRVLAKHGFVEATDTEDGRERRWKLVVKSFDISADSPEQRAAGAALSDQLMRQDEAVVSRFLREKSGFSEEWQTAAIFARSNFHMTPDEMYEFLAKYLELLRPFVDREEKQSKPEDSERVRLMLRAVPWPADTS